MCVCVCVFSCHSSCKASNKCCWNITHQSCQDSCPITSAINTATILGLAIGIPLGVLALVVIVILICCCYCGPCSNGSTNGVQRRVRAKPRNSCASWWSNTFSRRSETTEEFRSSDRTTGVHYLPDIALKRPGKGDSPMDTSPLPCPKYDQPIPIRNPIHPPPPSCTPPAYMPNGVYLTTTATPARRAEYESLRLHRQNVTDIVAGSSANLQDVRLESTLV